MRSMLPDGSWRITCRLSPQKSRLGSSLGWPNETRSTTWNGSSTWGNSLRNPLRRSQPNGDVGDRESLDCTPRHLVSARRLVHAVLEVVGLRIAVGITIWPAGAAHACECHLDGSAFGPARLNHGGYP